MLQNQQDSLSKCRWIMTLITLCKCNSRLFEGKEIEYSSRANLAPWFHPNRAAFQLEKTKQQAERPTNKQQMKVAAWQSLSREEFGDVCGLQTSGKTMLVFTFLLVCPNTFELLEMEVLLHKMAVIPKQWVYMSTIFWITAEMKACSWIASWWFYFKSVAATSRGKRLKHLIVKNTEPN